MTQVLNMLFIACALKAAFALKVTQQASVEPPTQACLNAVNALDQAQVQQCDEENGITAGAADIILAAASNADLSEPIADVVTMLETCGHLPAKCANAISGDMICQARMDSSFTSEQCIDEANSVAADLCDDDQEDTLQANVLSPLMQETPDLEGAFDAAGVMLKTCMGLSPKCAFQCEGPIVEQIVTAMSMSDGVSQAEQVEIIKRTTGGVKKQFENVRIKARTAVKKKSLHRPLNSVAKVHKWQ